MRYLYLTIIFASLSMACKQDKVVINNPVPAEQKTIILTVDSRDRKLIVYTPATTQTSTAKKPLIFVIHGGSGTAEGMIALADFRTIADRENVVLIYPEGVQNNWNDGRPTTPNQLGINDVNFFSAMIDYAIANYNVDASKVYTTGISNGGFMSSKLACALGNKFAAFASVAASMEQTTIAASCNPGNPVPAMYIQGSLDPIVPFNGGVMTSGAGGTILSHTQVINKWVTINNCGNPSTTNLPDLANDGTNAVQITYSNGTNNSQVVSIVVNNGGHTWPLGSQYLSELIIGKTSKDFNACETIWAFFKNHRR